MNRTSLVRSLLTALFLLCTTTARAAERRMEHLTRGVVAVPKAAGDVYIGWRFLGTDPDDVAFNVYRSTGGAPPVKLNATPITASTNFVDAKPDLKTANAYHITAVLGENEQAPSNPFILPVNAPARQYVE